MKTIELGKEGPGDSVLSSAWTWESQGPEPTLVACFPRWPVDTLTVKISLVDDGSVEDRYPS